MTTTPIHQLRTDLATRFPERKDVIDGSLAAVLAGEHVLLLGQPDPLTLCATSPSPWVC
jgi:MoxR-like ATPase